MGIGKKSLLLIVVCFQVIFLREAFSADGDVSGVEEFKQQVQLPKSMAVVGDSISAGAFAIFNRTDGLNPLLLGKFLDIMLRLGLKRSIKGVEYKQYSWATGWRDSVDSHLNRLNDLSDKPLRNLNAAVSGSTSFSLKAQVDNVLKWSRKKLKTKAPDYFIVEIGANDLCLHGKESMTNPFDYSENIRSNVERVLVQNPQAKVLLVGIPDVFHLKKVAEDSFLSLIPGLNRCSNMWSFHGFCENVLEQDSSSSRYREAKVRYGQYMHELENVKEDINSVWGQDTVRFASQLSRYEFKDTDISFDCFHPNKRGQKMISDITWEETWWSDL
jgi:lysophospholipase L1-like esterase